MPKVFLGGTVGGSNWRQELIPQLKIDYFDPVVPEWTEAHKKEEIRQRQICDYVLYTLTSDTKGFYSVAEVVDDSNKRPEKTVFCVIKDGFDEAKLKSLIATAEMVETNGGWVFWNLKDVAKYLNRAAKYDGKLASLKGRRTEALSERQASDGFTGLAKLAADQEPNTAGNVAMGAAGLAGLGASRNLILGKKRVYHGTSQDNWNQIQSEGLLASHGGTGASAAVGIPDYVGASQGQIHVSRIPAVANMYANIAGQSEEEMQNYGKNLSPLQLLRVTNPNGKRIKMDMDYGNWKQMVIDNAGSDDLTGIPAVARPAAKQFAAKGPVNITPAEIHGSKASMAQRAEHTMSKLPGYIAAHPGRFGLGLGLAGLGAYGVGHALHNQFGQQG